MGGAKASKEMIVGLKKEVTSRWFWSQNPVPDASTLFLGLYAYKVRTWLGLGVARETHQLLYLPKKPLLSEERFFFLVDLQNVNVSMPITEKPRVTPGIY